MNRTHKIHKGDHDAVKWAAGIFERGERNDG